MQRKDFLKGIGLTGLGSALFPFSSATKQLKNEGNPPNCSLIPSETAGPFPLDLTDNQFYFRQDVREDRAGVQLNLKMQIIGLENCLPMQNLRVNIWHCDKDGNYSGYQTQTGLTYLRGYQMTDANGEVEFTTIFPGWYNGRVCHIHFQVFVSSVYSAVSQLGFPQAEKQAIYSANPSIYTKGLDPKSMDTDGIFNDGYVLQVATLTPNPDGNGYDSYLQVAIQGSGTSSLAKLEPETGGLFTLGQNFPNPYELETVIPFTLNEKGDIALEIFDLQGKKLKTLPQGELIAGEHTIALDFDSLNLPKATYAYQLVFKNEKGIFRKSKVMTAAK